MREQADIQEGSVHFSTKLQNALGLDGHPIAISITSEAPEGINKHRGKTTLCVMIQKARRGVSFYCSGKNIICSGKVHVGIGSSPVWHLEDFLVRREKIVGSKTAARRMIDLAREQAPDLGKYIILSPLMNANFRPDVVVFVGTPLQISRILFLDAFETGDINTIHREPLCSGVIALPIATRQIGLSLLDMSCRSFGQYRPEEMVIGVPYPRVSKIVEAIGRSIAGNAKSSFLLRLIPRIINSDKSE
ncbi:MAG: DUF169 domain-containing protein [Dehalococcoidales bacterium]|nr:DUF169 domain-containing protein [Dehalococcoidales bacterium]